MLASVSLATSAVAQPLGQTVSQQTSNSARYAQELFRKAYENRYTWSRQFPGYTSVVELKYGKESYKANVRVNPDLSVEVSGIEQEKARQTIENQVRMLVIHRQRIPFEVAHKNSIFQMGGTDNTGAIEIFEQTDKTSSNYKVFGQKLLQVNRFLGKTAVTVDTLDTEATPEGYLATRYRSTFTDPQTKQVVGVEESEDSYKKMGGYYLPKSQIIRDFEQGKLTETAEFYYTNIRLLRGKR